MDWRTTTRLPSLVSSCAPFSRPRISSDHTTLRDITCSRGRSPLTLAHARARSFKFRLGVDSFGGVRLRTLGKLDEPSTRPTSLRDRRRPSSPSPSPLLHVHTALPSPSSHSTQSVVPLSLLFCDHVCSCACSCCFWEAIARRRLDRRRELELGLLPSHPPGVHAEKEAEDSSNVSPS